MANDFLLFTTFYIDFGLNVIYFIHFHTHTGEPLKLFLYIFSAIFASQHHGVRSSLKLSRLIHLETECSPLPVTYFFIYKD